MSSTQQTLEVHYGLGWEAKRLDVEAGKLERERTRELLQRFLPAPPATLLDVGGGPGGYACWLAQLGYEVHLLDIITLHVEQARIASAAQPEAPLASVNVGDARSLSHADASVDCVLLMGPLYHLTKSEDRHAAIRQAFRVLRPGGILVAVGISRFASALDGLKNRRLADPVFAKIVERDLLDGQHHNPTNNPEYFTDAYFHHPDELQAEVRESGFANVRIYAIEGPGWLLPDFDDWWNHDQKRAELMKIVRTVEAEPSLLGASAHFMVTAIKS